MEEKELHVTEEIEEKPLKMDENKSTKFKWTKDRIVLAIIFSVIILVSIGLLIALLINNELLFTIVRDYFIAPILSLHVALRILLFLALMIVQSLFAPIPSELILLSGGIIFGIGWGSVIGVVGSMFSAVITFYLSKRGGRAIIDASGEKVGIIKRTIYIFDEWINKWGLWAILVGRAVPVIMFDPISYAAGLANVKDWHYFLATFIGSIPRAIFYAFLGRQLIGNNPPEYILTLNAAQVEEISGQFNTIFFIIFGILVGMFALSNIIYYVRERKRKKDITEEEKEEEIVENIPANDQEMDVYEIIDSKEIQQEGTE